MTERTDRLRETLEILWKVVQIAAVLVGGFWTYAKFIHTEAPLFERNVNMTRHLSAPRHTPDGCIRSFTVGFENTGKSSLTVQRVVTRGLRFAFHRQGKAFAALLDIDVIQRRGTEVFSKRFPDPDFPDAVLVPFVGKYRAGERYSHEFRLLLAPEDAAWIYLETAVFVEGEPKPYVSAMWDPVCG